MVSSVVFGGGEGARSRLSEECSVTFRSVAVKFAVWSCGHDVIRKRRC